MKQISLSMVLLAVAVAVAAADKPDEKKPDKERIQGTWIVTSVEVNGIDVNDAKLDALKKAKTTFKGDEYTLSSAPDRKIVFRLDPNKKPPTLDLEVSVEGLETKAVFRYLYELADDNTLRLCSSTKQGDLRPKDFTSKGDQIILTLKREDKKPEK